MRLYIVTGASRGLGLALARQLAAEPDTRLLSISRKGVPADVASWRDLRVDLADAVAQLDAATAIAEALAAQAWSAAVLINNAGMIEPLGVFGRIDGSVLQQNIAVNLTAPIVLMNAFIAHSGAVAERSVVNISSGSGRRPMVGTGAYSAGKAGLDMMSRAAALEAEAAGQKLTITSLAPGIIETDMQVTARSASRDVFPEVERFRSFKADGLLKTAEEVAAKIIALERAGKLPAGIADVRELG